MCWQLSRLLYSVCLTTACSNSYCHRPNWREKKTRVIPPHWIAGEPWLPVSLRVDFIVLLLVCKALNDLTPPYIRDLLSLYVPSGSLKMLHLCPIKAPMRPPSVFMPLNCGALCLCTLDQTKEPLFFLCLFFFLQKSGFYFEMMLQPESLHFRQWFAYLFPSCLFGFMLSSIILLVLLL